MIRNLVRRAIDVGSGSIKCQVAEVDKISSQIQNVLYSRTIPNLVYNSKGEISPDVQSKSLSIIQSMVKETDSLNPCASVGIATEVFRTARNGTGVINSLSMNSGIPISIIDSRKEANLSFLSALGLRPQAVSSTNLVVWDAGAASFQISNSCNNHFDSHGSGTIHTIAEDLKSNKMISKRELLDKLLNYLDRELIHKPDWLSSMKTPYYLAVGSEQSIFNQCRILIGKDSFSIDDVESVLSEVVKMSPEELYQTEKRRGEKYNYSANLGNVPYILPKLSLLFGSMKHLNIDHVDYRKTCGNCAGILVDPSLWSKTENNPKESASVLTTMKPKEREKLMLTANWHLEKTCNYKCSFCYAHFADESTVNLDEVTGLQLLDLLKEYGITKVNFAGGEPLLNKHLSAYLKYAKELGFKTSIITNASRMTNSWIITNAPYLDQIGISCDSIDEQVNKELGRGGGQHVAITERAFTRLRKINDDLSLNIKLKLNTVVTRKILHEDWSDFVKRNGVERWKVFKVLKIIGENEDSMHDLEISDEQFEEFKKRHAQVDAMVPESNDDMTSSYLMITPDGQFYQNTHGKYSKSQPILRVGVHNALEEVGFDIEKFRKRGGVYHL